MDCLIKTFLLPFYLVRLVLKVIQIIAYIILIAFIKLLFGPPSYGWYRHRRKHRFW